VGSAVVGGGARAHQMPRLTGIRPFPGVDPVPGACSANGRDPVNDKSGHERGHPSLCLTTDDSREIPDVRVGGRLQAHSAYPNFRKGSTSRDIMSATGRCSPKILRGPCHAGLVGPLRMTPPIRTTTHDQIP
jgi:hypothetical protein